MIFSLRKNLSLYIGISPGDLIFLNEVEPFLPIFSNLTKVKRELGSLKPTVYNGQVDFRHRDAKISSKSTCKRKKLLLVLPSLFRIGKKIHLANNTGLI